MDVKRPALPDFLLLTWFGTVPCFNPESRRLVHVAIEALDNSLIPLGVRRIGGAEAAPEFAVDGGGWAELGAVQILKGMHPRCLVFQRGDVFIITKPDGTLEGSAKEARNFENFLPIAAADFLNLRGLLARHWQQNEMPAQPLGLDKFQLIFDGGNFPLVDNLPLNCDAAFTRLNLKSADVILALEAVQPGQEPPVIWIASLGNIGNRALEYLTAVGLASRVPDVKIKNIKLDMWGYENSAPRPEIWKSASTGARAHLDIEGLADCLSRREVQALCLDGYNFHLDHYPPRAACRELLPAVPGTEEARGFGAHELVCSVRGAEILRGIHPDYFPLPPGYYARLQEESGLELVFFGQLDNSSYSAALRDAFPKARFVEGVNQSYDFEVLRRSRNIAISISTFAWLAAWLSAAERIYLPVGGIFNPAQHPGQDFLPLNDPAYRYLLLPPVKSANLHKDPERFALMQRLIESQTRRIETPDVRELILRSSLPEQRKIRVKNFDSAYYLSQYPDAANPVRALRETALNHFLRIGAKEKRMHRPFDPLFYASHYPDASEAVALGYYPSLFAHFLEAGEAKGYKPTA